MKKLVYILLVSVLFPFVGFTQMVDEVDYVSPFHDGLAAIQKADKWAIIDEAGSIIIGYRDDLVPIKMKDGTYPILKNERALIKESKDGFTFYGYINIEGRILIEPQFINALNFKFDKAIVTTLIKNKLGYNKVMGKPVVSYEFQEIVIDNTGTILAYLTEPKPISNTKPSNHIPGIKSELISENLVKTTMEGGKIVVTKI